MNYIGAILSKVEMFPDMTNKGEQNIIINSCLMSKESNNI